jgi:beta-glucosidase
MRPQSFFLFVLVALMCLDPHARAQTLLYKDPAAAVDARVMDLLGRMTLEEKIDMLGGVEGFYIRPNERLGIPKIKMADGPLGVRNYGKATAFPAGIAFAATWNKKLTEQYGQAVGKEARSKGVHIMLAPGVNIYRAPMCGRNFEYYGEDPYLASRMAVAYITGVQSQGVVATIKHYAANNQEYDRHTVSSDVDERTLREIYLPTFRAAVEEAHVGAVMTSYNLVNGVHASQNSHLITDILKGDWKFAGIVMSDWGSVYDGVSAANAGLDLEMPSGLYMNRDTLLPALKAGTLKASTIDEKVRRMLWVMFTFGFFDRPQADSSLPLYSPESRAIALQAAREGIVLLKNRDHLLPLDRSKIKTIAVIGPNAHPAVTGAGGSSEVQPLRSVSFLDGIITAAGEKIKVFYYPGLDTDYESLFKTPTFFASSDQETPTSGLRGEYFDNPELAGTPAMVRTDRLIHWNWGESSPAAALPADNFSVRWTGQIRPEGDGEYEFVVRGDDGFRLFVNNELVIDEWRDQGSTVQRATRMLKGGVPVDVKLEYYEHGGSAEIAFGWRDVASAQASAAVRIASKTDVAIVCVGFNSTTEGEGSDRQFELPKYQEKLLAAVLKANKNTIVVLTAGGSVATKGWIGDAAGLLHVWYPGQEGGTALAEILFGDVDPSGRLPATFEKQWEDNATVHSYYDRAKRVQYSEGVFLGYRHYDAKAIEPLYPFGYGLSYTSFTYKDLTVTPEKRSGGPAVTVTFVVTNSGTRRGAEVPQVYVTELHPAIPRPVRELKAFDKVWLDPGESKTMTFRLGKDAFSYYDVAVKGWNARPGAYEISVGSSSRLIRFRQTIELTQ